VATWNVRGITHKLDELNRELRNRKIDIAVISEIKRKSKGSKELENYVMIYSEVPREEWASSGVAILVRKDWKNRIF
jgi:exonuclease III